LTVTRYSLSVIDLDISAAAGKRTAGLIGKETQVNLSLTESAEFSEKNKKGAVRSAGSARYIIKVSVKIQ